MEKPNWKSICALFMKIKEPRMYIWLKEECAIPRIFIIMIIKFLRTKRNGKRALFKWIFPLLSGNDRFDNAFGIKDLCWMVFVKGMSKANRVCIHKN